MTAARRRRGAAGFLRSAQGWPYLLTPFIPLAIALELAHADAGLIFFVAALGIIPTAALMGRRPRSWRRSPARDRRPAQRHLRQRAGADHRPVRAQRGPAGGRQGLDRRLDHRQRPARARRLDAGRRHQARAPDVQPAGGQHPGDDALPRRRGADDAGDLRAGRGPRPAEPDAPRSSTTARPSSTSRWRSPSSSSAPTSPGLFFSLRTHRDLFNPPYAEEHEEGFGWSVRRSVTDAVRSPGSRSA